MAEALLKIENVFRKIIPSHLSNINLLMKNMQGNSNTTTGGKLATVFRRAGCFYFLSSFIRSGIFCCRPADPQIGIRKILGASVFNLWQLLSIRFVMLVSISFLIASPLRS